MSRPSLLLALVLAATLAACDCGHDHSDAGAPDASVGSPAPDSGTDAGQFDAGQTDAGPPDAGPFDAGQGDAGPPDAGIDAGCVFAPDGGLVVPDGGFTCISTGAVTGWLYYARAALADGGPGTIWVRSGDGTVDQRVTEGDRPALSSDGRFLGMLRDGPNGTAEASRGDPWVHDLVTGAEHRLFSNTDYVVAGSFVPDAGSFVFDYLCGLSQAPLDGGPATAFPSWLGCYTDMPAVSPDGRQVAIRNLQSGLGVEDIDGSNQHLILPVSPSHISSCPKWSADMQWISYIDGTVDNLVGQARRLRPDGGADQALSGADVCGSQLVAAGPAAWTGDGQWAVTAGTGSGVNALYALATDGSGQVLRLCVTPGPAVLWSGGWVPALPPGGVH